MQARKIPSDIAQRYSAGSSVRELAKHYETNGRMVRTWLTKIGVRMRPRGGRRVSGVPADLVAQYQSGRLSPELAGMYGVHVCTVLRWLEQEGVQPRSKSEVAAIMRSSKTLSLGKAQTGQCCVLYRQGMTLQVIADRYRIAAVTVRSLLISEGVEIRRKGRRATKESDK